MPVSRGIMIMNRLNIRETTTELITFEDGYGAFIPPGPISCGDTVTCNINVTVLPKSGLSNVRPTGTISLLDTITNTVLGTDDLSDGGPDNLSVGTIEFVPPNGNYNLRAIYPGVATAFGSSRSSTSLINVTRNPSTIIFEGDGYEIACPELEFSCSTYFSSMGQPITEGFVEFRLYESDNIQDGYVSFGPYDLESVGDGYRGFDMAPGYLEYDKLYGIQAFFLGINCIAPSATASGVTNSALRLSTAGADITAITGLSAVGSTTFCRKQTKQFSCQVSADVFLDPDVGQVLFYCAPNPANTPLTLIATDTVLVDGYALATAPADIFPTVGNYYVYAQYIGAGTCYGNSPLSSALSVITTQNNVSATNDMEGFRATGFASFNMHLSSAVAGTISGSVTLGPISGITGPTLGPIICSGPHTGFDVEVPIPANTYSPGTGVFRFDFISDGLGCYGDRSSSSGTIVLS